MDRVFLRVVAAIYLLLAIYSFIRMLSGEMHQVLLWLLYGAVSVGLWLQKKWELDGGILLSLLMGGWAFLSLILQVTTRWQSVDPTGRFAFLIAMLGNAIFCLIAFGVPLFVLLRPSTKALFPGKAQ